MDIQSQIDEFFNGAPHAVVGASQDRSKYGNKVLRAYLLANRSVFPVNPKVDRVEGVTAYPDLASLPEPVHGISVITPPSVTEIIVEHAVALGITNIWMQPGSENEAALLRTQQLDVNVIAGGPCVLVVLGYRES